MADEKIIRRKKPDLPKYKWRISTPVRGLGSIHQHVIDSEKNLTWEAFNKLITKACHDQPEKRDIFPIIRDYTPHDQWVGIAGTHMDTGIGYYFACPVPCGLSLDSHGFAALNPFCSLMRRCGDFIRKPNGEPETFVSVYSWAISEIHEDYHFSFVKKFPEYPIHKRLRNAWFQHYGLSENHPVYPLWQVEQRVKYLLRFGMAKILSIDYNHNIVGGDDPMDYDADSACLSSIAHG
jgi:hypothetical protein